MQRREKHAKLWKKPWGYEEQTYPAASLWQSKLHQNILNTFLLSYSVIQLWNCLFLKHPVDETYQDGEDYCRAFSFKKNKSESTVVKRNFSLLCLLSLFSLRFKKWTIPHSQSVLLWSTAARLNSLQHLSYPLYERCRTAGTMHHSLCYYTHIFQRHPCQRWMVVNTLSSARGGRGDFSCLFLFIFLFLGGGRGGEEREGRGYVDA